MRNSSHKRRTSRHSRPETEVRIYDENDLPELIAGRESTPLLLVLDQVQDPHNLGACLRVADGAGATAVIIPKDRSAPMSDTTRQIASGAAESMPLVVVTNLARALDQLKREGLWIVGTADGAADDIYQTNLKMPLALVMGAEGKGLRRLTTEKCDFLMRIPMFGKVSCLNVSVAAGICLYEATRQRTAGV